jgi:3-methylfumaryl-CoA hydratase
VTPLGWEPHTVVDDVVAAPEPVGALSAIFDDGLPTVAAGDALPPLWHWVALPRWPSSGELGNDGHPRRGSFLPPVDLPRRMFAGGEVVLHGAVPVGALLRRETSVTGVVEKEGRSGRLVFVDVTTVLHHDGRPVITEVQNLVYREAGSGTSVDEGGATRASDLRPAGPPLTSAGPTSWSLRTDPVLLMRFSAATANAHRIHYDWPYATEVEGYPGLVVHGPLLALALAETARLGGVSGITRISHRNLAPLFCGDPAELGQAPSRAGAPDDGPTATGTSLSLVSAGVPRATLTYWTTSETSTERQHP